MPPARSAPTMSSAASPTDVAWVSAMRPMSAWTAVTYRPAVTTMCVLALPGARFAVPGDGLGGDAERGVRPLVGPLRDRDVEQVEHDQLRVPGRQRVGPERGRLG